ncbi:tripartite tricarboxylate transporter substrate binding protein [Cupriavidus ulmosensis]
MHRKRFLAALAAILMSMAAPAMAQQAWPARPVTLTVMYGAGGYIDLLARAFAQRLETALGQPVVIMNRPGAQGALALDLARRQAPDGYNLTIVTGSSMAVLPHLMTVNFTIDDFAYAGAFAMPRYGVAVQGKSPYKTMDQLIAAAKAGAGVFMGSSSALNTLILADMNHRFGTHFEVVAYKSAPEVSNALLGGQVAVIVSNPPDIVPYLKDGRMRLLASASPARWPHAPDVPTLKELGFHSIDADSWVGLAAPKGTPKPVMAKIEAALLDICKNKDFHDVLEARGTDALCASGAEMDNYLRKRRVEWGDAIRRANLPREDTAR